MKKIMTFILIIPILLLGLLLFTAPTADPSYNDGTLYELDLENPSTYTLDCYFTLTAAQWVVSNNRCTLTTSVINLPGDPEVDPDFDVPINLCFSKTGNLENNDDILIQYSFDGTNWDDLAHIEGDDIPESPTVFSYIISEAHPGSDVSYRIIMQTNDISEKITMHTAGGAELERILKVGTPYVHGTYELFHSASLPITLVSFTGISDKEKVRLSWLTSSEINNDHFEIERTTNGSDYQTVTIVQGAGNSNVTNQYHADDYSPVPGTNYYRIKQVDFDGQYSYSEIISINVGEVPHDCKLSIRPNPCMGQCQVVLDDCPQAMQNGFTIYIYDALGNVVSTQTAPVSENNASITLDANSIYKPGVYVVRTKIDENTVLDEKVVISK